MYKVGYVLLQGVLEYVDRLMYLGLWIMDILGQDIEFIFGMVVGGVQIVIFIIGCGMFVGNLIVLVIKIMGNKVMWEMMQDNIDIDVFVIMFGEVFIM